MQKIYGARTEPNYQLLKKMNSAEVVSANRLTLYNDAHIRTADGDYTGKKNFRFIIGSTNEPVTLDERIFLYTPYVGNREHAEKMLKALGPNLKWEALRFHASIGTSYAIFDSADRSLYLYSSPRGTGQVFHSSKLFLNSNCDFSSVRFENSLELPENVVYKLDHITKKLVEIIDLGE